MMFKNKLSKSTEHLQFLDGKKIQKSLFFFLQVQSILIIVVTLLCNPHGSLNYTSNMKSAPTS